MKITLITVCFNSSETIEKTIQSVVSQNYKELEYIIIDGGSTDDTLKIIDKYKDDISVCISEPDNGIYDAMNKGLRYASGDIIAFLNSDDWYVPDIQVFKKVAEYFNNKKADIVSGNMYRYKDGIRIKIPRRELTEKTVFLGAICPHPTMFARRELYSTLGGYDTSYQIAADTKWILEAYLNGADFLFVEDYFTYFREGGISTTEIYATVQEEYKVMLSCARKYHRSNIEDDIVTHYSKKLKRLEYEKFFKIALADKKNEIRRLFDREKGFYIWGAGVRGKQCLEMLERLGILVIGFIDIDLKKEIVQGYKVMSPKDIDEKSYICITPELHEEEIKTELESMGIEKNSFFTYTQLMDKIVKIGSL